MPIIDIHIHLQPWEQLKPEVYARMTGGRKDLAEIKKFIESPKAFLEFLDASGVERAGLINYPSPDKFFNLRRVLAAGGHLGVNLRLQLFPRLDVNVNVDDGHWDSAFFFRKKILDF